MASIDPHTFPIIGLLGRATDLVQDDLHRELTARGHPEIRDGHGCVFGNIEPDGSRLTELAERAGLTKQAVGEVVADLERLGYVERTPDPTDGRAKIIRLSERGAEAQAAGFAILADIERRWGERYGAERMAVLRELLGDVLAGEWLGAASETAAA
jgi:DNA-binding MarR family transcriptional regulator